MRALGKFGQIKEALAFAFAPPAVLELGTATGFDMRLVDLGGLGHEALMDAQGQLLGIAKNPLLASVRPNGLADTAAYQIEIDQEKASALGLSLADINASLSTILGSTYVNDFIDKNRVKRVMRCREMPRSACCRKTSTAGMCAMLGVGAVFRLLPVPPGKWARRSLSASMVRRRFPSLVNPLRGTVQVRPFTRSCRWRSHCRQALALPGQGCRMKSRCPAPKASSVYIIALLMVFLCLAALYESWAIPFSVMMDMPLGALGVVAATQWRGMPNDIYFQIGLITIIGLSAKRDLGRGIRQGAF